MTHANPGNRSNSMRSAGRLLGKASAIAMTALFFAQADSALAQDSASPEAEAADSGSNEIIVTAQRREQRTIDVPYNISAIGAAGLEAAGATNANDLTKVVAGLGNIADGPADRFGENNFSMRGLRTDPAGPNAGIKYSVSSVSTYYDDVPITLSLLLKDLNRVEVLRGPQGTLYGSGAQSGAIRFIPNRPEFNRLSGELNASSGITKEAGSLNYSADGVLNFPLADNLAVRVSGAYVHQAGFIDQVNLFEVDANGAPVPAIASNAFSGPKLAPVKEDTNSWSQWIARGAVRYEPSDWLKLDVSYVHQETDIKDQQVVNPAWPGGTADLSAGFWSQAPYQTRPGGRYANTIPRLQPAKAKVDLVTAKAAFDLGFADLSLISGYYDNRVKSVSDMALYYVTPLANYAVGYNHYPRFDGPADFSGREKAFTQEVRLVSKGDSKLSYVLGLYYQRLKRDADYTFNVPGNQAFAEAYCAVDPVNCFMPGFVGVPGLKDVVYYANQDFLNKEYAAFGELTYQVTPEWQITGGIRAFKYTQTFDTFGRYVFYGDPGSLSTAKAEDTKVVYKANTSYDIADDTKVYFTFAQGYRRGGANPFPLTGPSASLPSLIGFKPDIANNYEVGIKGLALDRRLTYSLSLYKISQKDFQFFGITPAGYTGIFNGELATSRGLEFEASFKVTPHFTLSGSYAYTDTEVPVSTIIRDYKYRTLVDDPTPVIIDNPGATIVKGARLPGVSKDAWMIAADWNVPVGNEGSVEFHVNGNYRSDQSTMIAEGSPNFAILPSVFTADARITYDSGSNWSVSAFVTNLTDNFNSTGTAGAQTTVGVDPQSLLYAGKIIGTPRTFGLSVHYGF